MYVSSHFSIPSLTATGWPLATNWWVSLLMEGSGLTEPIYLSVWERFPGVSGYLGLRVCACHSSNMSGLAHFDVSVFKMMAFSEISHYLRPSYCFVSEYVSKQNFKMGFGVVFVCLFCLFCCRFFVLFGFCWILCVVVVIICYWMSDIWVFYL